MPTEPAGKMHVDWSLAAVGRLSHCDAIVAVDVLRATTTIVTALSRGLDCYVMPSVSSARVVARQLCEPILLGEDRGDIPEGFDFSNSPLLLSEGDFRGRPIVLASSSGTPLVDAARRAATTYVSCLRNVAATVRHLAAHHHDIGIIGAGTLGTFREEDQLGCARVAAGLMELGYEAGDQETAAMVTRWRHAPTEVIRASPSAEYLRETRQADDLEFVIGHTDDLDAVIVAPGDGFTVHNAQAISVG